MARKDLWSREQTVIAFNLYCSIPFGQAHARNKEVQKVAAIIGRTPGAVARKLGNFGSLDPELKKRGIKGLGNRSKLDEIIWQEFKEDWNNKVYESTELIAKYEKKPIETLLKVDLENLPKGEDRRSYVKVRVYQDFFSKSVLAAYENTCCITGLKQKLLHNASHIKPWKDDADTRTNPQNGLCLNALHDRAFDKGLITVLPNYRIKISKHLDDIKNDDAIKNYFSQYHNKEIIKPHKFLPSAEFLVYHNERIFKK
jgi:putative restriction endonuclease